MDVLFGNNRIRKKCRSPKGKLKRRLDDLAAANNLEEVMNLPGHCHALKSDRAGQFAIHVEEPYRLVFEPANDPLPRTEDGHWLLNHITAIRLLELEDYHGS